MKFTNKFGLPAPLYHALTWDTYTKGEADVSVTELLKSPRQRLLQKRHDAEITIDASENLWSLMGRAVHQVLKNSAAELDKKKGGFDGLVEERLFVDVAGPLKTWKLGGEFDLLYTEDKVLVLADYKVSSVWAFLLERKNGFVKPDWEAQLNIYRWMLALHGFDKIDKLQIGGIIRDFKKSEAKRDPENYPQIPIMLPEAKRWPLEQVERFVHERVRIHQLAEVKKDLELDLCSAEERWERGESYAVMKKGRKSAVKVFKVDEHEQAELEAHGCADDFNKGTKDNPHYVEHRPGVSGKCEDYCYAAPFCNQYQGIKAVPAEETEATAA
jgi:hypothetical protein